MYLNNLIAKWAFTGLLAITTLQTSASVTDTTAQQPRFTKQQLVADAEFISNSIAGAHPNIYHSVTKHQYQRIKDTVINNLHDGMTATQAWPLLARLVSALKEGHSQISFSNDFITWFKSESAALFSVGVSNFDGKYLIVKHDASAEAQLQAGDKIISINNLDAPKLMSILGSSIGGMATWKTGNVCREIIPFMAMHQINGPYTIKYLHNNEVKEVVIKPLTYKNYVVRMKELNSNKPAPKAPASFTFNRLSADIGYMNIITLSSKPEAMGRFLDSAFTNIQKSPVKTLIIDLRQNGGGNSALGRMLLNYITDQPFRMAGGVRFKVSQLYKDNYAASHSPEDVKEMSYYYNAKNGEFIDGKPGNPKKPDENKLAFKGKVYVLIGPRTFSSANMLANTIQDYKLATLIGEPTGEPANDYGELLCLTTPNTKTQFCTSTKQFVRANGDKNDPNPVLPDYIVKDNPLTPADEVIEYVKQLK